MVGLKFRLVIYNCNELEYANLFYQTVDKFHQNFVGQKVKNILIAQKENWSDETGDCSMDFNQNKTVLISCFFSELVKFSL